MIPIAKSEKTSRSQAYKSRVLISVGFLLIVVVAGFAWFVHLSWNPNIWVTDLEGENESSFNYSIRNKQMLMTGAVDEFSIPGNQESFFSELKKTYKIFSESDNSIQLIYNNEIYTIKKNGRSYELYGEYFIYEQNENVYYFPFPTDKIVETGKPILRFSSGFHIACDLKYLKHFYETYGSTVRIEGNTIRYKNIILSIGDSGEVTIATAG